MRKIGQTACDARRGEGEQRDRAERFDGEADRHDRAPPEAVGDRAGDEHEQQRRQELRQADKAEIERVARQVVDLPADRDGLDLHGEAAASRDSQ